MPPSCSIKRLHPTWNGSKIVPDLFHGDVGPLLLQRTPKFIRIGGELISGMDPPVNKVPEVVNDAHVG